MWPGAAAVATMACCQCAITVLTAVAAAGGTEGSNTGLGIDYKVRRAEDCLAPGDVIFV